jgi:hypothetical protein
MNAQVKPVVLFKLALVSFGIGAALLLTPACKAQSEISPDHFDGTDSWVLAPQVVHAPAQKLSAARASRSAKSQKTARNSPFQLAAAREVPKPVSHDIVAVEPRPKAAPGKPEKQ